MNKLLAILLLMLMPLQLSWAAVGAFCGHEEGAAAQHLGHHEHRHNAQSEVKKTVDGSLSADLDCGFCHASHAMPLTSTGHSPVPAVAAPRKPGHVLHYRSVIQDGPDKPNWLAGA